MVRTLEKITIFIIALTASSISLFYLNQDTYKILIREDGILENLTAIGLLAGSIIIFVRIIKEFKVRPKNWVIFNAIMAFGLFFGFGEEISWGQRIFGVEANEFFNENNLQNETNLHNLAFNGVKVNQIVFSYGFSLIFGAYFLLSLFLFKKIDWIRNLVIIYGVPIPRMVQSIVFLGLTLVIVSIPDGKIWEIWECLFVLTFIWILLRPYSITEKPKEELVQ